MIPLIAADEALARLREGNARFAAGEGRHTERIGREAREQAVAGQRPFAAVLGCSDSRVPVEIVFDQGLGDLFVIRVAGNIVAPSLVGSVEFAADKLGTRLVVVLGHTGCGAVQATLEHLAVAGSVAASPNLGAIVERIRPAVQEVLAAAPDADGDELAQRAVRANVRASVAQLRHASPLIEDLILADGLRIVGAVYALETGRVDIFDVPAAGSA